MPRGDGLEPPQSAPSAFGLVHGASSPMIFALQWCGWSTESYDWSASAGFDLAEQGLQDSLLASSHLFWYTEVPCRDTAKSSHTGSGLRSIRQPWGLSGLTGPEGARMCRESVCMDFVIRLLASFDHDLSAFVIAGLSFQSFSYSFGS